MTGYDPKQKRTHSPTSDDGPSPVDDLLGPPPAPVHDPDVAGATVGPEVAERPVPIPDRRPLLPASAPPSNGPDPRVLVVAGVAVIAVLLWRRRRR